MPTLRSLSRRWLIPSAVGAVLLGNKSGLAAGDTARESAIRFGATTAGHATDWTPFKFPDYRRIILAARVNSIQTQVWLDSGAGSLAVNRVLAEQLQLAKGVSINASGIAGNVEAQRGDEATVELGSVQVRCPQTSILDLSKLTTRDGQPVGAILGKDLFDHASVEFDFDKERLRVWNGYRKSRSDQTIALPVGRSSHGLRTVQIEIENKGTITALVDSGADRPLSLSPRVRDAFHLFEGRPWSTAMSAGIDGLTTNDVATIREIGIGSIRFRNVPTEFMRRWSMDFDAIIGMPILRRMHLIFDYPHDLFILSPHPEKHAEPFRKDRAGIGAQRVNDTLQVISVAPGSPAEEAGFEAGDVIVAINGERLSQSYFEAHPRQGTGPIGTEFEFTMLDGTHRSFGLRDYY